MPNKHGNDNLPLLELLISLVVETLAIVGVLDKPKIYEFYKISIIFVNTFSQ